MKSFFSSAESESHCLSSWSGHGVSLRVLGDHAEVLLVGEDLLTQRVPALVEQVHVADLLDPFRCRMVRRLRAARHVVEEERHRGIDVVDLLHPVDGVVRHRGGQVPARIASVMISRIFGAPFGGTTRAGQCGFDWVALTSISPPNFAGEFGR